MNPLRRRPIHTLLIANRGEIAVRVIRAARELGIRSIAVYGDGEQEAMHARLADEARLIPSEAPIPYLDIPAIVQIAWIAGADAVHPGYGFLAENAAFARACVESNLTFVGPSAEAIAAMGDKIESRRIAAAAGVPVVPGSDGPIATHEKRLTGEPSLATRWLSKRQVVAAGGGFAWRAVLEEMEEAFLGPRASGSVVCQSTGLPGTLSRRPQAHRSAAHDRRP
jgi:acetyl/propionyl-CoA carboxylase alpha subunit